MKCQQHTYLTAKEEDDLAKYILAEYETRHRESDSAKPLPAPAPMCDLIF